MSASQSPANIINSYHTRFAGPAAVVATDAQGNVIRRANQRTYPNRQTAARHALRANFAGFERGVCFRAVPLADLGMLGA